jgi:hypothetical protein
MIRKMSVRHLEKKLEKVNIMLFSKLVAIHRSSDNKRSVIHFFLFVILLGLALTSCSETTIPPLSSGGVSVTIDLNTPDVKSNFMPGATFIHLDNNLGNTGEQQLLANGVGYTNVFIYGWGTDNPMPAKGEYDWSSLDERVGYMRNTKTTMMISLCCAPDWMKSHSNINTAPNPDNLPDFAELAKQVAARYKDVKYFQVWNELKGFRNDPTRYMQMYNLVYDAVKSVRPDAIIGGPYIAMGPGNIPNSVVSQWLNTKHSGELVVVDGGFDSTSATADFTTAKFYTDFGTWLRQQPNGGATLPFGWAEWYPGTAQAYGDANHFNATMTNAMIQVIRSGASYLLTWGVEGGVTGSYKEGDGQQEGLIDNGQPTPWYNSVKAVKDFFGPGTQLYKITQSTQDITVMASKAKTILVNHLGTNQTVTVNGTAVNLTAYQVLVINTPGGG